MGRRKRRILYKLAREAKQARENAKLELENSVAQEALREATIAPEVPVETNISTSETMTDAGANNKPAPKIKKTPKTTKKTVSKRTTAKKASSTKTKKNSSK